MPHDDFFVNRAVFPVGVCEFSDVEGLSPKTGDSKANQYTCINVPYEQPKIE